MGVILMRAACFIAVIVLGHILRRTGFFKEEDFHVLSKIVLKITLPAAIISNVSGSKIDPSLLVICLLGFGGGVLYMTLLYLLNLHSPKEKRAFEVLNISGYNIGTFTMPFAQSFLGPAGMLATSLFDTGNSFVCLGGSYSIAP
ncbi:AEC family transporter [Clostridium sp. OF09-36]|uniref:AEC family transporter n=1 Tax=Clostridium sp. OF09-36 TaxID=2292310 RepID=UPI00325A56CE